MYLITDENDRELRYEFNFYKLNGNQIQNHCLLDDIMPYKIHSDTIWYSVGDGWVDSVVTEKMDKWEMKCGSFKQLFPIVLRGNSDSFNRKLLLKSVYFEHDSLKFNFISSPNKGSSQYDSTLTFAAPWQLSFEESPKGTTVNMFNKIAHDRIIFRDEWESVSSQEIAHSIINQYLKSFE